MDPEFGLNVGHRFSGGDLILEEAFFLQRRTVMAGINIRQLRI